MKISSISITTNHFIFRKCYKIYHIGHLNKNIVRAFPLVLFLILTARRRLLYIMLYAYMRLNTKHINISIHCKIYRILISTCFFNLSVFIHFIPIINNFKSNTFYEFDILFFNNNYVWF